MKDKDIDGGDQLGFVLHSLFGYKNVHVVLINPQSILCSVNYETGCSWDATVWKSLLCSKAEMSKYLTPILLGCLGKDNQNFVQDNDLLLGKKKCVAALRSFGHLHRYCICCKCETKEDWKNVEDLVISHTAYRKSSTYDLTIEPIIFYCQGRQLLSEVWPILRPCLPWLLSKLLQLLGQ